MQDLGGGYHVGNDGQIYNSQAQVVPPSALPAGMYQNYQNTLNSSMVGAQNPTGGSSPTLGAPTPPAGVSINPRTLGGMPNMANPITDYNPTAMPTSPFTPGTPEYTAWLGQRNADLIGGGGTPDRPSFGSQIDPATGRLLPNLTLGDVSSKWTDLMKSKLGAQQDQRLGANAATAEGANAAAESALAMRGGLGSGARTSLAKDMARNINTGAQGIRSDISNQGLGVDIQGENNNLAANQFDIGNALNETTQNRAFNSNIYNEAMKSYAALKTGQAQSGGGKK